MVQKVNVYRMAWLLIALLLIGCAGDEDDELDSFLEVTDQRLASFEVVEGGVLSFNDETVEEFDPDQVSPYSIELSDQSLSTITLRVTPADTSSSLILIEQDKDKEDEDNPEDRLTDIVAGESFPVQVDEGTNIVFIRVQNDNTGAKTDYFIEIDRISSSADLTDMGIFAYNDLSLGIVTRLTLDPEFDPDITEYTASAGAAFCEVQLAVVRDSSSAELDFSGGNYIEVDAFTRRFIGINEGENDLVISVSPEDGGAPKVYTITLTRESPSDDFRESDTRLKAIDIADGRESTPFRCTGSAVTQVVTNTISTTGITLETDFDGASIAFGDAQLSEEFEFPFIDSETGLWAIENEVTLTSGEQYTGDLLSEFSEGNNYFVANMTSSDGDSTSTFLINIVRSENNEVFVSTAEELQQALINALPNDAIVMETGDYLGVVGLDSSGSEQAHFFSDVDGTAEEPILLISNVGADVRLLGDDLSQHSVLRIEGDYWQIADFEISGAQNGLVLDGASQGLFNSLIVNDVGERALTVTNGSADNLFSFVNIDDAGLMPQTRDGIDEVYGEAIVVGGGESASENNRFTNMTVGKDVLQAVDIKADAANTQLQYSTIDFDNTISQAVDNRTIISVASDGNEISFNQFNYDDIDSGSDDIAQIIGFDTLASTSSTVYQNGFDLEEDTSIVALRNTGDGAVVSLSNLNADGSDVVSEGSFDSDFADPIYQIRSTLDDTQCLAIRDVVLGDNEESDSLVVADDCADEAEQRWQFIHDTDGYVFIVQASNPNNKMFGVGFSFTAMREDTGSVFDDAFALRWRVLIAEDEVIFATKDNASNFIIEAEESSFNDDDDEEEGDGEVYDFTPVTVGPSSDTSGRNFTLVRLN